MGESYAEFIRRPTVSVALVSAVALTLLSEFLQNAWVSLTYNIPIEGTMITGISSLVTAMANNVILFPTVGLKTITFVQEHYLKQSDPSPLSKQVSV